MVFIFWLSIPKDIKSGKSTQTAGYPDAGQADLRGTPAM